MLREDKGVDKLMSYRRPMCRVPWQWQFRRAPAKSFIYSEGGVVLSCTCAPEQMRAALEVRYYVVGSHL